MPSAINIADIEQPFSLGDNEQNFLLLTSYVVICKFRCSDYKRAKENLTGLAYQLG